MKRNFICGLMLVTILIAVTGCGKKEAQVWNKSSVESAQEIALEKPKDNIVLRDAAVPDETSVPSETPAVTAQPVITESSSTEPAKIVSVPVTTPIAAIETISPTPSGSAFLKKIHEFKDKISRKEKGKDIPEVNTSKRKLSDSLPPMKEYTFPANKDKDISAFKKASELKWYKTEEEISKEGGKYLLLKMMTYREYLDSGFVDDFDPNFSPDRMVWVKITQYNMTAHIEGAPIEQPITVSTFDAETGNFLGCGVGTAIPHGADKFKLSGPPSGDDESPIPTATPCESPTP